KQAADSDSAKLLFIPDHDPNNDAGQQKYSGSPHPQSDAATLASLIDPGIKQHNHEHKQHHDRAGIDDDLNGSQELRPQQQVDKRQRAHDHHQRQGAVDRVALGKQVDSSCYAENAKDEKKNLVKHLFKLAMPRSVL